MNERKPPAAMIGHVPARGAALAVGAAMALLGAGALSPPARGGRLSAPVAKKDR